MSEPKIARFRSRRYLLDIARTPGVSCAILNADVQAVVVDGRTVWRFEFADEKAAFDFIAQHAGTISHYASPWNLYSISKTYSRSRKISPRFFWRPTDSYQFENFHAQLSRWKRRYPQAEEAKLMQLVLHGRRAGLPESLRDTAEIHRRLNERYQRALVANRRLEAELRDERSRTRNPPQDPRVPEAIKMMIQQQLLFWRYAHQDQDKAVFAIGLRMDTCKDVNDLISSMRYFHGKGDEAVLHFRRMCDEHALTNTDTKLALYVHGFDQKHPGVIPSGVAMVLPNDHDKLAHYSKMRTSFLTPDEQVSMSLRD